MILWIYTCFAAAMSPVEDALFTRGDVDAALSLPSDGEMDCIIKYFINKRFKNNMEEAARCLAAYKEPGPMIKHFMGCNWDFQHLQGVVPAGHPKRQHASVLEAVKYMAEMGSTIKEQFLANRYDFMDVERPDMPSEPNEADILLNLGVMDASILQKFYRMIYRAQIHIGDVREKLEFLASKLSIPAFGLVGDIYFFGINTEQDLDKAISYYTAGRRLGDPRSIMGVVRLLMSPGYEDPEGAMQILSTSPQIVGDPEVLYLKYQLITQFKVGSQGIQYSPSYAIRFLLRSATAGYLPAVYDYSILEIEKNATEKNFKSLQSMLRYSPIVANLTRQAVQAYKSANYMGAVMYYLLLAEYKIDVALKSAFFIIWNHKLFRDNGEFIYNLLGEIVPGNPRYNKFLGDCYYIGMGVTQSYTRAFSYYTLACEHSCEAAYNVCIMYEFGRGIPRNLFLAYNAICQPILDGPRTYLAVFYTKLRIVMKIMVEQSIRFYILHIVATWIIASYLYAMFVKKEPAKEKDL